MRFIPVALKARGYKDGHWLVGARFGFTPTSDIHRTSPCLPDFVMMSYEGCHCAHPSALVEAILLNLRYNAH